MRKRLPKILITGAAGFIGSAFVRLLAREYPRTKLSLVIVDKLTYAGDLARLKEAKGKYKFYKADIVDEKKIELIFRKENPQIVINFAAESHVDRSIKDASSFVKTNIEGTRILLEASRKIKIKKFIHISTDEVYGDIKKGKFYEDSSLKPSSPYAASKAAADLLINSYVRTFGLAAIIIRPSNNYGPWQYPEKFIPLSILKVLNKEPIPVYGDGKNVREWLYVDDCARGILKIMQNGKTGEIYNLGSSHEKQNIAVAKEILAIFGLTSNYMNFVKDRLGHDIRYRLDSSKAFKKTGWKPKIKFDIGIRLTTGWCLENKAWLFSKLGNIKKLYKNAYSIHRH